MATEGRRESDLVQYKLLSVALCMDKSRVLGVRDPGREEMASPTQRVAASSMWDIVSSHYHDEVF